MPKLSKKARREWGFYIRGNGRREYNALCLKCACECKQSFRAIVCECRKFDARKKTADKGMLFAKKAV